MRAEHSSRVGQAWAQTKALVFNADWGTVALLPIDHFRCVHCNAIIRIDTRGYAACEVCGQIYNDGKPPRMHEKRNERKWATKHFLKRVSH